MLKPMMKDQWILGLQWGDIVLVRGKTFFGFLQNILNKLQKVDERASHGAVSLGAGKISEADGTRVWPDNDISRYFSDHHNIWVFRYTKPLTEGQKLLGQVELDTAAQAEYGWGGIIEQAKIAFARLFKKTYVPKDRVGMFCTEHCSHFARSMFLPWVIMSINGQPRRPLGSQEVTPSILLDWMLDIAGPEATWELVASYDKGSFLGK